MLKYADKMNLTIRKTDKTDAKLLAVLGAVTFYEAYFETDEPHDIANYITETYDLAQIESEIEDTNSHFFIAEVNGSAVGFAKLRENSKPECLKDEHTIELHRIYIVERFWRKGIGRKLVDKCLQTAKQKGYKSLWLGTWDANTKAQEFYKKLNFTEAGEYQYYYGEHFTTNLVFKKNL